MNNLSGPRNLWRHFSFWYTNSFFGPFWIAFMSSMTASIWIPYRPNGVFSITNFMVVLCIAFVNIMFISRLAKAEVATATEEFKNDPEFQRLQEMITRLREGGGIGTVGNVEAPPTETTIEPKEEENPGDINS